MGFPFHIWSWRKRKCHSHLFHSGLEGYERYVPVDLVGTSWMIMELWKSRTSFCKGTRANVTRDSWLWSLTFENTYNHCFSPIWFWRQTIARNILWWPEHRTWRKVKGFTRDSLNHVMALNTITVPGFGSLL